jgi:hypothetical protein
MNEASRHYLVVDKFFSDAGAMRRELDRRIADKTPIFDAGRFAWEYWHVPGQFSQQRAPARAIFSNAIMQSFERRLLDWTARNLGLFDLGGPPWVSYLVDGQFQSLHRDSPNGLFAFSFGLSKPDRPRFRGGETLLARPELLDYWRRGGDREETADTPMFDEVPPRFNRLLAFDARVPHAVRTVEGPRLAREGRVAIQGWLQPRGCLALDGREPRISPDDTRAANAALSRAKPKDLRGVSGLATFRAEVARTSKVRDLRALVDVLVSTNGAGDPSRAHAAIASALARAKLPSVGSIVIPVLVLRGRARVGGGETSSHGPPPNPPPQAGGGAG